MKSLVKKISIFTVVSLVAACSQNGSQTAATTMSSLGSADPQKEAAVSFKLTDAPNRELKSVFVNIDHMEVVVAGRGKAGRVILAQDLGLVDLLTLQNGVTLPLQDVIAPDGLQIQQIRLVLKGDGHYAVKSDDSICELKTPSAQKTGVKIILTNKFEFEAGHQYDIVVDFDALKSVVIQGNGGCLLKPVLKLKSAYKKPIVVPEQPGSEEPGSGSEEPGSGSESGGSDVVTNPDSGSETGSESGGSDVVTNPDSGSETGGTDSSGGTELVTTPEQNDPSNDGYAEEDPIVDTMPVLTPEQMRNM